ncbi:hypothetical protein GF354_06655 [Candidatus Peregrinibacteria bacterium]|nr:hypothetical protein [Candidatus Peregrinibacteria bacterium]
MKGQSLERLRRSHELEPSDADTALSLVHGLLREGQRDEVFRVLEESSPEVRGEIIRSVEELKDLEKLRADYNECGEILTEFEILKEGETSYVSDYRETAGIEYEMPSWEEVFMSITREQLQLYRQMEEEGLEPKLQLTPIGLNIRTLASKIDDHRTMPNQIGTYIWNGINDEELKYEPDSYDASDPTILKTNGGKSKGEWIKENRGWLIDIVATKQNLDPDPKIQKDFEDEEYTSAQKTKMYHEKFKREGFSGLSYESYIIAQMRSLKERKPLEVKCWTILPDSSIANREKCVSNGGWYDVQFLLSGGDANSRNYYLRCRPSVRVKRGT